MREEEIKTLRQVAAQRLGHLRKQRFPRIQAMWDSEGDLDFKKLEDPSCGSHLSVPWIKFGKLRPGFQ